MIEEYYVMIRLKTGIRLNLTEFLFLLQGIHRVFNTLSYSLVLCLG